MREWTVLCLSSLLSLVEKDVNLAGMNYMKTEISYKRKFLEFDAVQLKYILCLFGYTLTFLYRKIKECMLDIRWFNL